MTVHFNPQPKTGKRVDDPKYRHMVRTLPCAVCEAYGFTQTSDTEFHHTISGRYSQAKTSCCYGIGLCGCHHTGQRHDRDRNKVAIHDDKPEWEDRYGLDTEYTAATLDRVERETGYIPKGIK